MAKSGKQTRGFRERNCAHCKLADKRALKKGRPCCKWAVDHDGQQPDIRNGHCAEMKGTKNQGEKGNV